MRDESSRRCSRQLVRRTRDLEHLDVRPPRPNGYREFDDVHLSALRGYRHLAIAVGPAPPERDARDTPAAPGEALSRLVALHADLARSRYETIAPPRRSPEPGDTTRTAELSTALDAGGVLAPEPRRSCSDDPARALGRP
ncbi:hypothetical protein ACL03H_17175 [Saccharopolyspora sp. MS10]|uniref:hypothetical protein n=1 Tax=Saccharopolyspora sp. MS10 TaxID=3385973 RepID=UPI00399FF5AF